jgi:hypothetical protein
LGEDACLSDEDVPPDEVDMGLEDKHDDLVAHGEVENLLNHLSEDWQKEQLESEKYHVSVGNENPPTEAIPDATLVDDGLDSVSVPAVRKNTHATETVQHNAGAVRSDVDGGGYAKIRQTRSGTKSRAQRTTSCPPGKVHSGSAGPWSLEWAHRHKEVVLGNFSKLVPCGNKK